MEQDLLGTIFQALTKVGGGSELVPLLVFCLFLVAAGLGLGLGVMRLIRRPAPANEPDADQSA